MLPLFRNRFESRENVLTEPGTTLKKMGDDSIFIQSFGEDDWAMPTAKSIRAQFLNSSELPKQFETIVSDLKQQN